MFRPVPAVFPRERQESRREKSRQLSPRNHTVLFRVLHRSALCFFLIIASTLSLSGQVNSWTKATSGNWEEPVWSLGMLPGAGQSIMITNAGSKTVTVSTSTAQNFSQSLNVNSVVISSPATFSNSLRLNNAGVQMPLTVSSMTIASNSSFFMLGSALQLNGPMGVGMSIGGQFTQVSSVVAGNQLDIGYIGPGVFNLESGLLSVGHVWIGGPFEGVFNQTGGTNRVGIVHLEPGGQYNFYGGDFGATVYFGSGSLLTQKSGLMNTNLTIWRGSYHLEDGVNHGGLVIPVSDGFASANGNATVLQTGGTNFGAIQLGVFGTGSYTLSNGGVQVPEINIGHYGHFIQRGGTQTSAGNLDIVGGWVDRGDRAFGYYTLDAGIMSSPGLYMDTASFTQNGGTNLVNGQLIFANTTHNYYYLNNGLLSEISASLETSWVGGFFQNGGVHVIDSELSLSGNTLPLWQGYVLNGGELRVSNIVMNGRAIFTRTGGSVVQSGFLTLSGARINLGPMLQQFGEVLLTGEGNDTNSTLAFPTNSSTVIFADSSDQSWSPQTTLTIENWMGAYSGGGAQRLVFGTDASALTPEQLKQVRFLNPPGMPPDYYFAKILSNGEVVPDTLPSTSPAQPIISLISQPDKTVQITVTGQAGLDYGIEISPDLLEWNLWTHQVATNGSFSVLDTNVTNTLTRFYRAILIP
jgi:hypothetical protein